MAKFFIALCMLFVACSADPVEDVRADIQGRVSELETAWEDAQSVFEAFPSNVDSYIARLQATYSEELEKLENDELVSQCASEVRFSPLVDIIDNAKACGPAKQSELTSTFEVLIPKINQFVDDFTLYASPCSSAEDSEQCLADVMDRMYTRSIDLDSEIMDFSQEVKNLLVNLDFCAQEAGIRDYVAEINANYETVKKCANDA